MNESEEKSLFFSQMLYTTGLHSFIFLNDKLNAQKVVEGVRIAQGKEPTAESCPSSLWAFNLTS